MTQATAVLRTGGVYRGSEYLVVERGLARLPRVLDVERPEIAAVSMSGSSIHVALNALTLKRPDLPGRRSRLAPTSLATPPRRPRRIV